MGRLAVLARKSKGPYPDWFQDWVEAEKVAKVLWYWAPLLVPGIFQTEAYARAILCTDPECGEVGAHAGLAGAASVADLDDDGTSIVYLDAIARPQTIEDSEVVSQVRLTVNALRADALPRGASRDLIMKVAEERWS